MRTVLWAASFFLFAAGLTAQETPGTANYLVVGTVDGAPDHCSTSEVANHVARFFAAMNAGDAQAAAGFFGRRPAAPFQWFSFSDRGTGAGFTAEGSPDSLAAHFARRHAAGHRWVLRGLEFNGWVPERSTVGFLIFFENHIRAAGFAEGISSPVFGKGEFHCPTSSFVVMSLGFQDQSTWERLFRTHVLSRLTDG